MKRGPGRPKKSEATIKDIKRKSRRQFSSEEKITCIGMKPDGEVVLSGTPNTANAGFTASTDQGQIWGSQDFTSLPSGFNFKINEIEFIDEQLGWAVGSQGQIFKTENGGGEISEPSFQMGVSIAPLTSTIIRLTISPNPVKNNLMLSCEVSIANIIIYDINGRVVRNSYDLNSENVNMDISSLEKGAYILDITLINGDKTSKKIIKN